MVQAYQQRFGGGWIAEYRDSRGIWRVAGDARQLPIICETRALALSVARYRRRRLTIWN
jgi:hypothetical protein